MSKDWGLSGIVDMGDLKFSLFFDDVFGWYVNVMSLISAKIGIQLKFMVSF